MSQDEDRFQAQLEAQIEVLERQLNSWLDKSRPEFRSKIEHKQLLQKELELSKLRQTLKRSAETQLMQHGGLVHSQDYRSVTLGGHTHSLTGQQAQVIQILHEACKNGTPEVGSALILEQLGTPNSRLRDTFKTNQSAWRALIVSGRRKGTLRLNL